MAGRAGGQADQRPGLAIYRSFPWWLDDCAPDVSRLAPSLPAHSPALLRSFIDFLSHQSRRLVSG
jgi:hypothetical protein